MNTYRIICTKHGKDFQEFMAYCSKKDLDVQLYALLQAGFTSISYYRITL